MWNVIFVLILTLTVMASPVLAGPYEDAEAAYARGDYTRALTLFRLLAEQGDAKAQLSLGSMYDDGKGIPQNHTEAVQWYRRAAEQGNVTAQGLLGFMYYFGTVVPQNYAEALMWLRQGAQQDDDSIQEFLGHI